MFLSWIPLSEPQVQKFEMSANFFCVVGNTEPSFHLFIVVAWNSKYSLCYCTNWGVWSSSNIHHPVCERQEMKLSNIHCVNSSCLLVRDEGGTQVRVRVVLTHHDWTSLIPVIPILANMMLLGGQTTELHMNAILTIASYTNGASFPIQFAYRPKATPFASEACETNRSLVRTESWWMTSGTVLLHCSQPSCKFQHASRRCVGIRQAMALIGNARQATSEGRSDPVETGLTGLAATALE